MNGHQRKGKWRLCRVGAPAGWLGESGLPQSKAGGRLRARGWGFRREGWVSGRGFFGASRGAMTGTLWGSHSGECSYRGDSR
jgi:hypothetical protein